MGADAGGSKIPYVRDLDMMGAEDLFHAIAILGANAQAHAAIGAPLARDGHELGFQARGANERFRPQGVMRAVEEHDRMLQPALRLAAIQKR